MSCLPRVITLSDKWVKWIFLLLGIGILVPWNAFINAIPYFQRRICSIPGASAKFESWVGLLFNLAAVISLSLLLARPWMMQQFSTRRQLQDEPLVSPRIQTGDVTMIESDADEVEPSNDAPDSLPQNQQQLEETAANIIISNNNKSHSFWLVVLPLMLYFAVFVLTDVLVIIKNASAWLFLVLTLLGIAICGACSAFAQAGMVAASSTFPAHIGINPFVSGQAVGGVGVSVANFLSAIAEDPELYRQQHCHDSPTNNDTLTARSNDAITSRLEQNSNLSMNATTINLYQSSQEGVINDDSSCVAYDTLDIAVLIYFLIGAALLFLCVLGFTILEKSARQEDYDAVVSDFLPSAESTFRDNEASPQVGAGLELSNSQQPSSSDDNDSPSANAAHLLRQSSYQSDPPPDEPDGLLRDTGADGAFENQNILKAVKGPAFCIFFTFFVTLALFPSWTSLLKSTHQCQSHARIHNDLYTPFTFVLFNVGDLCGRLVADRMAYALARMQRVSSKLVVASVSRCLLVPLLLICVGGNDDINKNHTARIQVQNDFFSMLIQLFFAFSNGLLISMAFMHTPTLLSASPSDLERSAEILSFALSLGLLCGSSLALYTFAT